MKVILIMLSLYMLFLNIRGYKNLFKSNREAQKELDRLLNEESRIIGGKDNAKGFAIIVIGISAIILIAFHVIVGTIVAKPLVIMWAALIILLTIRGFFISMKVISNEKVGNEKSYSKITTPINTLYIAYFIYYVLLVM